ncbi:hypothetical protein [Verminephrobacter eiseniae]|uniref:hypothetical protein n=1 Tax=Verminephrobacter eiseniae TaxID=364317 RepID=UPI001E3DD2D7|nr:hypothetical protein [Verminephrobacter eiseniae]
MQRQHQQTALQRAPHGGKARRRDLLENRHQKAQCAPLMALPTGEIEAIGQMRQENPLYAATALTSWTNG